MFQGLIPVLVLRKDPWPPTHHHPQSRMGAGRLETLNKMFSLEYIVYHIFPKGCWVFLLNGNRRAIGRYLISKYSSIVQKRKRKKSFSVLKMFFQHSRKRCHIDKHSCNLMFPIKTLHLLCGNKTTKLKKEIKFCMSSLSDFSLAEMEMWQNYPYP